MHRLFVSVDMDEWYLGRWATGSVGARWPSVEDCFRQVYGGDKPGGEIYAPTEKLLALFDALGFKSTFFFTGFIARHYPDLVQRVAACGHEVGCHNEYHLDYEYETRRRFVDDLTSATHRLEDLASAPVWGYRSPNSSIPASLVEDLEQCGYRYDSSVTPTRRLFGKFGAFTRAPQRPYHPAYDNVGAEGGAVLWEFPWAVFPWLKLPAGSGIMHRIGGHLYNAVATCASLNKGHTSYYFHPYEIDDSPVLRSLPHQSLKMRLFFLQLGAPYYRLLEQFLRQQRARLVSGRELLEICAGGG